MELHKQGAAFRLRTTTSLFLLSLTAAGLTALPAQAAPPSSGGSPIDYVAVGDSYTAGQGAAPYVDTNCYQSLYDSYPAKVDALKGVALKSNTACSGASTADIPNQLTYVDGAVKLVTVTVGGIDAGSNQVAAACHDGVVDEDCQAVLTITETEELELEQKLSGAYSAIRSTYPNARVAVMGYPKMFAGFYLAYDFPKALNDSINTLNRIIREQTLASGVSFVDVREEFTGHEIGTFRPWINYSSSNANDPANFHPNATGYKSGYYQALVNDGLVPKR